MVACMVEAFSTLVTKIHRVCDAAAEHLVFHGGAGTCMRSEGCHHGPHLTRTLLGSEQGSILS